MHVRQQTVKENMINRFKNWFYIKFIRDPWLNDYDASFKLFRLLQKLNVGCNRATEK